MTQKEGSRVSLGTRLGAESNYNIIIIIIFGGMISSCIIINSLSAEKSSCMYTAINIKTLIKIKDK